MEMQSSNWCKICSKPKQFCEFCNISICFKCEQDLYLQSLITCTLCVTCYLELPEEEVNFYYGRDTAEENQEEEEEEEEEDY
jgi:hypothetical protein